MFALAVGAGLVYGATWIGRKIPTVIAAAAPLFYVKEKRKTALLEQVVQTMDNQLKMDLSPYYSEDVELNLINIRHAPEKLKFLVGKRLVLTNEEMFFLQSCIDAANKGESTPFNFSRLIQSSEARLQDPDIAKEFE